MKKNYLLILLLSTFGTFAQSTETQRIANAEMKAASALMSVAINPNTTNYDVTYHKLEFTVDPAVYAIAGKVTTTYTALANMSTVTFDLVDQLVVASVKKNNVSLAFTHIAGNNELVITLPAVQTTGTSATLEITYSGTPAGSGFGSFVTDEHAGTPVLWTLSEPFGARDWWPCKQDVNDKVNSIDVYITAPNQYNAVSNGLQQSAIDNGDGTKTTHYHHGYAIPAYLIAMAVTDYQIYTQQGGLGTVASPFFPIINYMYPETAAANQASVAITPTIINFYESIVGDYPFRNEKYGHCQFAWGGGMEHTTVSFMTAGGSGAYGRDLIAHEMGHQWFGDKVTCGSWKDIWLNEGFATYMAAMVIEHLDGDSAFIAEKTSMISNITSQPAGAVYLTDAQALDVNRIFDNRLTYNKGGMVLNMLRFKLGDTNFFQGLRDYLNDTNLAYAYAHTPDLKNHLETVSGMDLDEFFNDWVYNQGYPIYSITAQNIAGGQVKITVNQTTSSLTVPFFEMPVPVRIFGAGGQQMDLVLDNTTNGQVFIQSVPFAVTGITFDPKKNIISKNNTATLGTTDFDLTEGIQLYPNPALSTVSVSLPNGVTMKNATIHNILGQVEMQSESQTTWDVSAVATGVHFITLVTDAGTKKMKFIKK
ncbi:MAG TPA: M1 family aminopeptidase [Flavobacterium sp.]|nr:M1 family aminopeptidase [Flavobacterium sp.]